MDGLFVDASAMRAERPKKKQGSGRAADRRRQRGDAPVPEGPRDTNLALQQRSAVPASPPEASSSRVRGRQKQQAIDSGVHGALACLRGPEAGAVLPLAPGSYTVGRARENDLVLKDIACSRKHIRVDVDGGLVRLVDLGSGNGTKVNGRRISEVELRHGDNVELGSSLLVFNEPGRTVQPDEVRGEAQARVVAAADELAKELSEKLRFGDDPGDEGFVDGHGARTRALRTADARAIAEEIAREADAQAQAQANEGVPAARHPNETGSRRPADRLWNETFTNMPLSAVVPDDARLQGTARDLARNDGRDARDAHDARDARQRRDQRPAAPPPPPRDFGPIGTAAIGNEDSLLQEMEPPSNMSFLTSVLVTAGIVVIVGVLGIGIWALLFRDAPDDATATAVIEKEKAAEYAAAMSRAQQAVVRRDFAAVREYAIAALQVRPDDAIATTYQKDAEMKLAAAKKVAEQEKGKLDAAEKAKADKAAEKEQAEKEKAEKLAADKAAADKLAAEKAAAAPPPRRRTRRTRSAPTSSAMSDDEAKGRFERSIDAFRSKDDRTGCKLLDQVADRAPSDSIWKGKAEALYLKRCGD